MYPKVKCARCGTCCSEPIVPITHKDLERLVEYTGKAASDIVRFCSPSEMEYDPDAGLWIRFRYGKRAMVLKKRYERCIFLSSEPGCTAYPARPQTCRTFPYSVDTEAGESGEEVEITLNKIVNCKAKKSSQIEIQTPLDDVYKENCDDYEYDQLVSRFNASGNQGGTADFLKFLGF